MNESSLMVRYIEPVVIKEQTRRRRRRLMESSATAPSPSSSSTTTSNNNSSSSNSNSTSSDSNSSSIAPSPSSSSSSSSSSLTVQSDTYKATPPKSSPSSSSSPPPSKSPPPPPSSSSSSSSPPPPQSNSPPPPSPKSNSSPPPPPSPDSDQSPPPESSESPQPPPSNAGSYSPPPPVTTPSSSTSSSSNDSPSPPPPPPIAASSQSSTNATPNTSNAPSPTSSTSSSSPSSSNSNSNSNSTPTPTSSSTNNATASSNGTSNSTPTSSSTNNATSSSSSSSSSSSYSSSSTTTTSSNETPNSTPTSSSSNGTASPSNETSSSTPASSAPSPSPNNSHTGAVRGAIIGAVAGVLIILLLGSLFLFIKRKRKRLANQATSYHPNPNFYIPPDQTNYYGQTMVFSGEYGYPPHSFGSQQGGSMFYHGGGGEIGGSKSVFSYEELMEITNGFSRQNIIGEGGFGCVYRGQLHDGRAVAVKQLKAGSGQGEREFRAEVDIISRVHHRHLVSLVGYCISEHRRLLIYEFVPNKTLEHHLHGNGMPVLEWTKRLKIALGSAKGLAYLHEDCHPKIIHRDIKSANILLDDAFEAQVADFGLAKLTNDAHTHVSTRVMGTFGYLAPEYASSGKLTDRSDVFSFGVVLLELLTGRKPVDSSQPFGDESLVEWARPRLVEALESGDFSELVDPRLGKSYVESELIRMMEAAAACIRHSAPKRPRMAQVVRALDCDEELSDLSNGVKFGQSIMYNSDQYSEDIIRFRRMADGYDDSMEYESTASKSSSNNNQSSWKSTQSSSGPIQSNEREIGP